MAGERATVDLPLVPVTASNAVFLPHLQAKSSMSPTPYVTLQCFLHQGRERIRTEAQQVDALQQPSRTGRYAARPRKIHLFAAGDAAACRDAHRAALLLYPSAD